jgi:hypothetical protein
MRKYPNFKRISGLKKTRGQAAAEMAFLVPLLMLLLFGVFQVARVFYLYHTLQKALRGGAGLLARSNGVNYCDLGDPNLLAVQNFIVFGNLQGVGSPLIQGLTPELIQIFPERIQTGSTAVAACLCTSDADSCDVTSGGRAPDFVTINLGPSGFPVLVPFPFMNFGAIPLKVSVRMPLTGS